MNMIDHLWAEANPKTLARAWEASNSWTIKNPSSGVSRQAATYHEAGHVVAHEMLPVCGAAGCSGCFRLPGTTRLSPAALSRLAIVGLAGPAAEGFGAGSFYSHPGELALAAFLIALIAKETSTPPETVARDVIERTAGVLGANWDQVRRYSRTRCPERSINETLGSNRETIALGDDCHAGPQEAKLTRYLNKTCAGLIALAHELYDTEEDAI